MIASLSSSGWTTFKTLASSSTSTSPTLAAKEEADDQYPTLEALLLNLRRLLLPTPRWSRTLDIIESLAHVELYRQDIVYQASQALSKKSRSNRRRANLEVLGDVDRSKRRRSEWWSIVMVLCRAHILWLNFSQETEEQFTMITSLREYFPPTLQDLDQSNLVMHINLDPGEIEEMKDVRGRLIKTLKDVTTEWEAHLTPNEQSRKWELYVEKFGHPFHPNGGTGLVDLVIHYTVFVEKDAAALDKTLAT